MQSPLTSVDRAADRSATATASGTLFKHYRQSHSSSWPTVGLHGRVKASLHCFSLSLSLSLKKEKKKSPHKKKTRKERTHPPLGTPLLKKNKQKTFQCTIYKLSSPVLDVEVITMASSLAYLNSKADNGRENAVDSGVWSAQVLKDGPSLDVCWQMVDHQHQQRRTQKMQRFFHLGRHLLIKHLPRDVTELVRSSKRALFITLNLSACLTLTSRHIFHHQISTLLFNPLQPPIQPLPAFAPPSPGFSPAFRPAFPPAFRPAFPRPFARPLPVPPRN